MKSLTFWQCFLRLQGRIFRFSFRISSRVGFAVLFISSVTACTTASPERFKDDIGLFAAAVGISTEAYQAEAEQVRDYAAELEIRRLITRRPSLSDGDYVGACGDQMSSWQNLADDTWKRSGSIPRDQYAASIRDFLERCKLLADFESGTEKVELNIVDDSPQHTRLLDALNAYAKGLSELADSADDKAAFETAAKDAKNNFLELLASTNGVVSPQQTNGPTTTFNAEFSIIGDLLIEALSQSLEADRRRTLGRIVETMHPVIEEASKRLAGISRFYHLTALSKATATYENAVDATTLSATRESAQLYEAALKRVIAAQDALFTTARFDPGSIFDSMVSAHAALKEQLEDPKGRIQEVAGSVQDFYQKASRGLETIESLRAKLHGEAE